MTPATAQARLTRRALGAQAWNRAAVLYRDEATRLDNEVQFAVSALSAIGHRARRMSRNSARVRALGLDFLPDGTYLAYCIRLLRTALNIPGSRRRRLVTARAHVDEVHAMLQKAIDLTATIDIPGELGTPLNFVSALQTSARDGLASLSRLRDALDTAVAGRDAVHSAHAGDLQPSQPAQWLVHTASQLLPTGSRERYIEEFSSDLREFAEARA